MQSTGDSELLRRYVQDNSDDAFTTLVEHHIDLVYSVALRQVGNPHLAEEITQAVFIILAKKAHSLRHHQALSSWLFQTTRLTANNFLKSEMRRHHREQEAHMRSTLNETEAEAWQHVEPLLDTAVAVLREKDRQAILLRFYEGRNLREIGSALGTSEGAAEKRVNRALERLRNHFQRRGVNSTTDILASAISANSVQLAPVAMAKSVATVAIAHGAAASVSTLPLINKTLKIMAWTKTKTAIVAGICMLLAAGATTVAIKQKEAHKIEKLWRINKDLSPVRVDKLPPMVKILPTKFTSQWANWNAGVNGDKFVGANARLNVIAAVAYGIPFARIRFSDVPTNRFDFIATLPQGSREALQRELKTKFGLVGHVETQEMDVLLLKVNHTDAPGFKPAIVGKSDAYIKEGTFHTSDAPIGIGEGFQGLATYLEGYFRMPVIDQTGITGHFSLDLRWREQKPRDNPDGFKQALLDKLGLELVPAHMPVEILVIEKQK